MSVRRIFLLVVALSSMIGTALGFGDNGHIAVAKVADHYLSNTARQKIDGLLNGKKIYARKICMFADTFKHTLAGKFTKPWHYADIPLNKPDYKASRDCVNNDCVVFRINEQIAILKDADSPPAKRAMALKFIVHFLGDIHQPLHCAERNGDAGGNDVHVRFLDHQGVTNLHSVWDGNILDENMQDDDPEDYGDLVRERITAEKKMEWEQVMDPESWANEGHKLAKDVVYIGIPDSSPTPFVINDAYVTVAKPVVEVQIQKAGVRLAKLLNDALQ